MTTYQRLYRALFTMATLAIALLLAMCCSSCAGTFTPNAVTEEVRAEASSVSIPPLTMGASLRGASPQDRRAAMAQSFWGGGQ